MIRKKESKKHLTTKERIAAFCDKAVGNVEQDQLSEVDWGKPLGKEI
jgi:hypothetical protein